MTATPVDNSLSNAEAMNETPVAPGQEELLNEFLAERDGEQQAQETEKILGKFNSAEELAKAYQELEKKLGQPKEQPSDSPVSQPKAYTRDEGVKEYGEFLADKFEEAEFNPYEMAAAYEAGQDVEPFMERLESVGIPRSIVERYLEGSYESDSAELSADDTAELKGLVGGDEQFQQLSAWVKDNVPKDEIDEYNAVVASGNKDAIRWALRAMQARATQGSAPARPPLKEPELVGSGRPPGGGKTFESKAQVLEAMNKLNGKGQRLYDVDEAYRAQVIRMLDASDVF
jgi:hypothetical protein